MPKDEPKVNVSVRLPPDLLEALERLAQKLSEPGRPCTVADVARMALTVGVGELAKKRAK